MDERNFKDIIKQVQQVLYCPTCGRRYQLDEIRLKGMVDDALLLQTVCSNNHPPVLTVYMTNSIEGIRELETKETAPAASRPATKRVTKDDVLDLHQGLQDFDGDFRSLWNMT